MKISKLTFLTVFLLGLVFILALFHDPSLQKNLNISISDESANTIPPKSSESSSRNTEGKSGEDFIQNESLADQLDWKNQVAAVAKLDQNPEEIEKKLKEKALTLSIRDLEKLTNISLDFQKPGDERALAAYLISFQMDKAAVPFLEQIALTPISNQQTLPAQEFEMVVRAIAIEGLGRNLDSSSAQKSLRKVIQATDNSFLSDRAHREMQAADKKVAPSEAQDLAALKKLLNRSSL